MDFRVTHFLVAASGQTAVSTDTITTLGNGELAAYLSTADSTTTTGLAGTTIASAKFYFAQGIDRTDAIQKELGLIKSGVIDLDKIVSIRKVSGTDARSRQVKFFGSAPSSKLYTGTATADGGATFTATADTYYTAASNNHLYYCIAGGATGAALATSAPGAVGSVVRLGAATFIYMGTTTAASLTLAQFPAPSATTGTLEIEADKEYSFSVRVRSAKANSISPFGLTRGYSSGAASATFVNPSTGASQSNNAYAPFAAMFNLVKAASIDPMLTEFATLESYMTLCNSTNGTITDHVIFTSDDNITTTAEIFLPTSASTVLTPMPVFIAPAKTAAVVAGGAIVINVKNYVTWNEALAAGRALVAAFYTPTVANASIVAGHTYTASLILEGLDQTNYNLSYASGVTDPTVFPFKFDYVRLNGYFLEGPYGQSLSYVTGSNNVLPINAGVSTQTPITFDKTQSGLITVASILSSGTYVTNSLTLLPSGMVVEYSNSLYNFEEEIKFPNLLKEEVRHIAHQYQSYSLKYKQQFRNPRYNAMVMDPFQSKIDYAGPYTLYYIEYMPDVDTSYTSTQPMTNLTIIAVPTITSGSGIIQDIDEILTDANITAESAS
jgi:hypothetical protein